MTIEEEKRLGRKVFLEMEKNVEFVKDPTLQAFLNRLGRSLVSQVGGTPFEFKFYLVKAVDPNAYALPGGYIFVTTGLLVLAETEHEVAGVLSHEIAHVTQRHVARMIERSKQISFATLAAIIAGVLLGRGGKVSEATATTAVAMAEAQALRYTRESEIDADQNSLQYIIQAGYDPKGLITFLTKIQKASLTSASQMPAYLSTHPVTEKRPYLLETLIQISRKAEGPFRSIENFKKIRTRAFVEEREANVTVSHFQSMVDNRPEDGEGYYGLGLAYRKMGRLDRSTETLQRGTALSPGDPDLFSELGITYFLSGRLDPAIQSLERAQSLSGAFYENSSAVYYLGRGYQERGELPKALPFLLRVKEELPEFSDVYYHLGSLYSRMGQKGLSYWHFGKYFKLRGEEGNALIQFRKAADLLERGTPERGEVERELAELTGRK